MLEDPALPGLGVLLGDDAEDALKPAVAREGGNLLALRPRQVLYRPGRRVSVRYDATITWQERGLVQDQLVAVSEAGGAALAVWRFPDDPALPDLRAAAQPDTVRELLGELVPSDAAIEVVPRAYRPRGRAVLEIRAERPLKKVIVGRAGTVRAGADRRVLYVKVLPPRKAERLHALHQRLAATLPVARSHWSAARPGLVVLEQVAGQTLRRRLVRGRAVPSPAELVALLDQLAETKLEGKRRRTSAEKLRSQAELLRAVLPDHAERVERLRSAIGADAEQPSVTTHGDFHESQVLIEDARISGLLDVDDAGPGHRVDDLALMAGRLWSLGQARGDARISAYAGEAIDEFRRRSDPAELDRRIAAVLVGRATGPFRNQLDGWREEALRRLETAERWLHMIPR